MSHFPVLVIGSNVEEQLAPYHEFECTGLNDQHVQDIDITDEIRDLIAEEDGLMGALSYHGLEDGIVTDEADVERDGDHKFGYAVVQDGELIKAVNRSNPNAKWDWWMMGGRWSGFLKLKGGADGLLGRRGLMGSCADEGPGRADQALKGDIDFAGMRDDAGNKASELWDGAKSLHNGESWKPWEQVRDEHEDIDQARSVYHAQPPVNRMKKAFDNPFFSVDQFLVPREQYVQQARDGALLTYAALKDGKWMARGEMGWFGMSTDKLSEEEWSRKFNDMLDGLPDDTLLTVVDCHI